MARSLSHRLFLAACVAAGTLAADAAFAKGPAKTSVRRTGKTPQTAIRKAPQPTVRKATGVRRSTAEPGKPCPEAPPPVIIDIPEPEPDDFDPGGKTLLSLGSVNTPIDKEGGLFGNKGKTGKAGADERKAAAGAATTQPVVNTAAATATTQPVLSVADAQRAAHAANVQIAMDDLPRPVVPAAR